MSKSLILDKNYIIDNLKSGKSIKEIAGLLNINSNTLARYSRRNGIFKEDFITSESKSITSESKLITIDFDKYQNFTAREIADELNIPIRKVRRLARKNNVILRQATKIPKIPITVDLDDLINKQNKSYVEIGRMFGITGSGVKKAARSRGVILPSRLNQRNSSLKKKSNSSTSNKKPCNRTPTEELFKIDVLAPRRSDMVKRLISEGFKEQKCELCGESVWPVDKVTPMPLQLHHKNGINFDNRLENLQILCPTCHALTDNFGSKNIIGRDYYKKMYKLKSELSIIDEDLMKNDLDKDKSKDLVEMKTVLLEQIEIITNEIKNL